VPRVDSREAAFDESRAALQIERHRNRRGQSHFRRQIVAALTKPLEQDITAQREARESERLAGMLANQALDDEVEIGRLSRMIKPPSSRHLSVAGSEDEGVSRPPAPACRGQNAEQVVRLNRSLETMENEQPASMGGTLVDRVHPMQFERIPIRGRPTLDASREPGPPAGELPPEGS